MKAYAWTAWRGRAALSLVAGALSYGCWVFVLRGAPKVIDATAYWLQARALSRGVLTWAPPGPIGSFAGRFLLVGTHGRLGGIFPQGWPLALSAGFAVGAPWLVGCVIAALIAWVTGSLAASMEPDEEHRDRAALVATALSTLCATMRFHTAETMSHGAAALAVACAMRCLAPTLMGRRASTWQQLACGLAVGWLVTIRPVSALAIGVVSVCVIARDGRAKGLACWLAGVLPGVVFHVATQRAVTGRWGEATQALYYAVSDGPLGCFRYGFGEGVGCRVEHGAFVESNLPRGYGALEAAGATLRRLRAHALDVANFEGLMLAWVWVLALARRRRAMAWAVAAVLLHIAAYVPFYFDGNIAGGGARMFVDVLPIEHALLGVALARKGPRWTLAFVALSVLGGALCTARGYEAMRSLPDHGAHALVETGVARGLVLVDDDHAFGLLHAPGADARTGVVVARHRGDAHDAILHAHMGRPPTWRLRGGALERWEPQQMGGTWWFRGASLWPPRAQSGGYARPRGDGAIDVLATGAVTVRFAMPAPWRGSWCARAVFADGIGEAMCAEAEAEVTVNVTRAATLRGVELRVGE